MHEYFIVVFIFWRKYKILSRNILRSIIVSRLEVVEGKVFLVEKRIHFLFSTKVDS